MRDTPAPATARDIDVALTNSGTVNVQAGTLLLDGGFNNFSGTTLTGGTYVVSGTLEFSGADIQTNAANIVLDGAASRIINTIFGGQDALRNFASNTGSFTVQNGRNFSPTGAFSNAGTLTVGSGSTFTQSGAFSNFDGVGTLTGGTYQIGGTFQFTGANIRTDAANIALSGAGSITDLAGNNALANLTSVVSGASLSLQGSSLTTRGDLQNAGTVAIDAASTLTSGGNYIQTDGSTTLNGTLAATTTNLQGGVLSGTGTVSGDLLNAASVIIGNDYTAGTLTVSGNYTQSSSGNLTVKVGGPNAGADFDQLVINGAATLDGTLTVTLVGGFTPAGGDSFTVLTFASETGTFATLAGDGPLFTDVYDPADVTLTAN
jgi:formylmethanofuran dehydrogenase subunit C